MEATRTCTQEGCGGRPVARGLCRRHYWHATKDQHECRADGCTKRGLSHGLCQQHAQEDPDHPRCTYPGCDGALRTAGLCFKHYQQHRKGDELRPFVDWTQIPCRGPLCKRMARYNTGYCLRHHRQKRDHGEVWVIGARRGKAARVAVCLEPGCESTRIAARGRCYLHMEDADGGCWLPWCQAPATSEATGLCDLHRQGHNRLMHFYGIGWPERLRLSEEQAGKCAICDVEERIEDGEPSLHVDHCHVTGKVRGLLCGHCNRGLGLLRDDTALLRAAIWYLDRNRLEAAIPGPRAPETVSLN